MTNSPETSESHDIPVYRCAECGYKMEVATAVRESAKPREGCVGLCLNCAAISIFTADLTLRAAVLEDLVQIRNDSPEAWKNIERVQRAIRRMPSYKHLKTT